MPVYGESKAIKPWKGSHRVNGYVHAVCIFLKNKLRWRCTLTIQHSNFQHGSIKSMCLPRYCQPSQDRSELHCTPLPSTPLWTAGTNESVQGRRSNSRAAVYIPCSPVGSSPLPVLLPQAKRLCWWSEKKIKGKYSKEANFYDSLLLGHCNSQTQTEYKGPPCNLSKPAFLKVCSWQDPFRG